MKFALFISFLNISFFALAMDAPRETNELKIQGNIASIKTQMEANGYAIFNGIDQSIFSDEDLKNLAQALKVNAVVPPMADEAHRTARMHESSLEFLIEAEGNAVIRPIRSTLRKASAQQIITKAAQQILKILPSDVSGGVIDLLSYSDLERELEAAGEEIMNHKDKYGPKTLEFELLPLVFHQDRWEGSPYDFLYFQVLELNGFTKHHSLIGHLKSNACGMRENAEVATSFALEDLLGEPLRVECTNAAGYFLYQESIVHSRTATRTFVSSIFDKDKTKEYGFTDEEGQRLCCKDSNPLPIRLVFIARIRSTSNNP